MAGRNSFDGSRNREVSGEELHALGKRAAARWAQGASRTLTDAVVASVKEASQGLGTEHVRRVVEFANTEAHNAEFRKQGSADRVVDFGPGGPASAAEVLRLLNDGSAPGAIARGSSDYDLPPAEKRASGDEDAMLAQLFPSSGPEAPSDPLADARRLRDKVAGAVGHARAEARELSSLQSELLDRLAGHAKQAALGGVSLAEIARVWAAVGGEERTKEAFGPVMGALVDGGAFADFDAVAESLQKVASARAVEPGHPLASDFRDYCLVSEKLAEAQAVVADGVSACAWFDEFEKAAGKEGILPAAARFLGSASQKAEGVGRAAGHALGGETGAKALGLAGKAAPYAAAGLAANEAYRSTLKYNPVAQGAKATILSAIPGTQEYNQREYELAMGGGMF